VADRPVRSKPANGVVGGDLMAALEIANGLEEARKAARSILGDAYDRTVEPMRELVRGLASEWKCKPLQVPLMLRRQGDLPESPLLLLAATLDVTEERA